MRVPLRTAHGPWTEREGLLVRLEDEDGRIGYGEVAPIPWFGTETLPEAEEVCRKLGDKVTDAVLEAVPERCGCVRFALACARETIVGRGRHTAPDALEGTSPDVPRPSGTWALQKAGFGDPALQQSARLPVTALLPAGRGVLEALPARLEARFIAFKWKVGVGDAADELALLDDVLAQLPAYAKLRLDANGAWDRRTAAKWLARCAERPVEFVEQPLSPADEDGLLGLAGDFPVTLALDESVVRLAEARRWQSLGWPGVFVIKPALAGPLDELGAWVGETKADVVLSSAIETALGRAAILRFVLMHPALTERALGFGVGEVFDDRCWDGPIMGPVLDAGWLTDFNEEVRWNALA
jgi:O-succinylbenzoate synthase